MSHSDFVYILKCSDNSYYTGVTNDLTRRLYEHNTGYNPDSYTYNKRPLQLVFQTEFKDINQAIDFEKKVKGCSRAKKEALIKDDWNEIVKLASIRKSWK